jgi:hypothetical protein
MNHNPHSPHGRTNRITESDLRAVVARLNRETNSPLEAYTKAPDSTIIRHPGAYFISFQYNGVILSRILPSGGEADVFQTGAVTKRQLYDLMQAFLVGYGTCLRDHS